MDLVYLLLLPFAGSLVAALMPTHARTAAATSEAFKQMGLFEVKRELRTFDVPGFGPLEAFAHWRIASGRAPSPRMHVVDLGTQIAVVYAGPHLPNASSN